ncbi:MAG: hypothetical protein ACOY0T_07275 [Myxococcota bacterium]
MEKAALFESSRQPARVSVLLPGLYAWATTVALPASALHAPWWARALAGIACVALLLSPFASVLRPSLGQALGIHAFVGASLGCWAALHLAGFALAPQGVTGAFGAFGWMLFAFAWGELRARRIPESDPHVVAGPPLSPRHSFRRSSEWVLALGTLGAGALLLLAWRVDRPNHAVLAQACALFLSLLVVAGATRVALERVPRDLPSSADRYNGAASALAVLVLTLGLGLVFWMLER